MAAKLYLLLQIRALNLKSLFRVEFVWCCHLPLLLNDPTECFYPPGVYKAHLSNSVCYLSCSHFQFPVGTSWLFQRAVRTSWPCFSFCSSMCVSYYMEVCWEVVCHVKMWWKLKEDFRFWPQFFYIFFPMHESLQHSQKRMWKQLKSKLLFSSLGLKSSFLCVFWKSCFPNMSFTELLWPCICILCLITRSSWTSLNSQKQWEIH